MPNNPAGHLPARFRIITPIFTSVSRVFESKSAGLLESWHVLVLQSVSPGSFHDVARQVRCIRGLKGGQQRMKRLPIDDVAKRRNLQVRVPFSSSPLIFRRFLIQCSSLGLKRKT